MAAFSAPVPVPHYPEADPQSGSDSTVRSAVTAFCRGVPATRATIGAGRSMRAVARTEKHGRPGRSRSCSRLLVRRQGRTFPRFGLGLEASMQIPRCYKRARNKMSRLMPPGTSPETATLGRNGLRTLRKNPNRLCRPNNFRPIQGIRSPSFFIGPAALPGSQLS